MVDSLRVTVARARPITSRSLAKPSMSTRRTANKARDRARHHVVNWRRSSAYASLVRPRYPATNPARVIRSASVKTGWIVASAADGTAVIIGHLPARLKPGSWARPGPSGSTEPQRKPPDYVTLCQARQDPASRRGGRAGGGPVRGRGLAGRTGPRAGRGPGRAGGGGGAGRTRAAWGVSGRGANAGAVPAAVACGAG